jgi:hypothetical protein
MVANSGELGSAVLESVLGATPQEFESPILRQLGTRESASACSAGELAWTPLRPPLGVLWCASVTLRSVLAAYGLKNARP